MRRRNSESGSTAGGREGGLRSPADGHGWVTAWADTWGEPEQERVARWLDSKGRSTVQEPAAAAERAAVRPSDPWEIEVARPPAAPAAPPVETEPMPAEQLHARAALEAEIAFLEEERRRLAASLEDERSEAERVRRELSLAASMLHDHIAGLEQERRRVLSGVESAVAEAEQARADEQAARASLETVRAEARAVEAKHFEVWIALDTEVSALAARRRRLRALRGRHRTGVTTPAS